MWHSISSWSYGRTICGRSPFMNWDTPAQVFFSKAEYQWKIFRHGWAIAITIRPQISTLIWNQTQRSLRETQCRAIWPSAGTSLLCKSEQRCDTRENSGENSIKNDERLGPSKTEKPSRFKWCRWWDSNPHGVAPGGFWIRYVYHSITPAYFTKFCRRGELQGRTREKAAFIIPQKPNNCKGHANPMCQ